MPIQREMIQELRSIRTVQFYAGVKKMRQSYVYHMKTSLKYTVTGKKQMAEPFLLKGNHNTN